MVYEPRAHVSYNRLAKLERRRIVAPRIPIPKTEDLTEDIQEYIGKVREGGIAVDLSNMLLNTPASIKEFNAIGGSILFNSELPPRPREIAVLRIGHITKAAYEWHHHKRFALSVGVTEEEIGKIATDGPVTELDEEGNLLCRVADEITHDIRLSDEALAMALDRYGPRQTTELILCCCWFNLVSRFLESTGIEIESPE
jgi:alkylhydroperoxidase family enzyme